MRLRPGANYYEQRNHTTIEDGGPGPLWVRRKSTQEIGYVTRACPSGNHTPAQAHVMFGNDHDGYYGLWLAAKELERAW